MKKLKKLFHFYIVFLTLFLLSCEKTEQESVESNKDSTENIVVQRELPVEQFNEIQEEVAATRTTAITKAVAKISPAIVSVNAIKIKQRPVYADPFFQRFFPGVYKNRVYKEKIPTLGSGFIVSADGYVVTNDHVAGEAAEITVNTSDGKEYSATLVGGDFISDIALLKIDGHTFHTCTAHP